MEKTKMTIFANMRIDDAVRFQHLKDSFRSFSEVSDDWIINVRGKLRNEVIQFLKENLGDRLNLFELLDESRGWAINSLDILKSAKYDYIFWWIEDHVNLMPQDLYAKIMQEMRQEKVDYLIYSPWLDGEYRKIFEVEGLKTHQYIDTVYLTKKLWRKQLKKGYDKCIIACMGIYHKDFFIRLLKSERFKFSRSITTNIFRIMIVLDKFGLEFNHRKYYDLIDRLFFGKLTKWPKDSPFDLERSAWRLDVLPFKMGLAKHELFAGIDDDFGPHNGYQLIKRGFYPIDFSLSIDQGNRIDRSWGQEEILEDNGYYLVKKCYLQKDGQYGEVFCSTESRIRILPRQTIINIGDDLLLKMRDEEIIIKKDETITIYPNIKHQLIAKGDNCVFITMIPKNIV